MAWLFCNQTIFQKSYTVYLTGIARARDTMALMRILPVLAQCDVDTVYQDTFLHLLISHLANSPELFANTDFFIVVIEQFLLVSLTKFMSKK